jgi:hypothetical protein
LRLISSLLRDEVIFRLFGRCSEMETDISDMELSGAADLMETIDNECEADGWG